MASRIHVVVLQFQPEILVKNFIKCRRFSYYAVAFFSPEEGYSIVAETSAEEGYSIVAETSAFDEVFVFRVGIEELRHEFTYMYLVVIYQLVQPCLQVFLTQILLIVENFYQLGAHKVHARQVPKIAFPAIVCMSVRSHLSCALCYVIVLLCHYS